MKICKLKKYYSPIHIYRHIDLLVKTKSKSRECFRTVVCNKGCGCYHLLYRKSKEIKNADK